MAALHFCVDGWDPEPISHMMGKRNNHTPFLYPEHAFSVSFPRPSALQYLFRASQDFGSPCTIDKKPWDCAIARCPLANYEKVLTLHTTTKTNSFFSLMTENAGLGMKGEIFCTVPRWDFIASIEG
jgi:hypothetical protein